MNRQSFTARAAVCLISVAACTSATVSPADAQVRFSVNGSGGGLGGAAISSSAFARYTEILRLDQTQKEASQALFDAYRQASQDAGKQLQKSLKSMEADVADGDHKAAMKTIPEALGKHGEASAKLTTDFMKDLKSLLTAAQAEQYWPKLERYRRRASWLKYGPVSGSSVDLVELVARMKLPPKSGEKLSTTLDQYELDMDHLLVERENADAQTKPRKPGDIAAFDPAEFEKLNKRDREHGGKLRELNQRYARLLGSLLPDDQRAQLEQQFQAASFKSIYKAPFAQKSLKAAQKFDDLTAEQQERLRQIEEQYTRDLKAANDRWAAAQEKAEADGKAHSFPILIMDGAAGDNTPSELADARKARRDLDKRAKDELAQVLNDDQEARLPQPSSGRRMPPGATGRRMAIMATDDGEGGGVFVMAGGEDDGPHMLIDEEGDEEETEEGDVVVRQLIVERHETSPPPGDQPTSPPPGQSPAPK